MSIKLRWSDVKKPELIRNLLFLEVGFGLLMVASIIWNAVIATHGVRHGFTLYFTNAIPKEFYIGRAFAWTSWALCGVNGIALLLLCRYIKKNRALVILTGAFGIAAAVFGIVLVFAIITAIQVSRSIKNGTVMDDKNNTITDDQIKKQQSDELEKLKLQIEIEKLKKEVKSKDKV